MSIKDLTSDMLGEMEREERFDNPSGSNDTTDPLQGLSVMASVAGAAEPHVTPPDKEPKESPKVEEPKKLPPVEEPEVSAKSPLVEEPDVPAVLPSVEIPEVPELLASIVEPDALPPPSPVEISQLIENDIEVVVPVRKKVITATGLTAVYAFKGSAELGGKLTTGQKRGIIKSYLNGMGIGHVEQQLKPFCNWFDKLRFANAVLNPEDGKKVWHFRHVLLCPECKTNTSFATARKNFYSCLQAFYKGIFHASPSMDQQVARAVEHDISIMVLAVSVPKSTAVPKSLSPYSTSLITVSAVSFQMHRDPNDAGLMSVFLSLLGVAHHATAHPPSIKSWRRNGMGLFMLIQVIKRCASIEGVTKIEIFLQCSEPSAFNFYSMIGFRQRNKGDTDDGFGILPEHLRTGLASSEPSAFLRFPIKPTKTTAIGPLKAPFLMHLPHCGLRHLTNRKLRTFTEDKQGEANEITLSGIPFWCQYPPPKLMGGRRLEYEQKDADNLFASLPLLRKLFPTPLEPLLPAASMRTKGEMEFERRKQHSEQHGKKWFSTGEVDLMLSILLCDGRYEDAAFILPVKWSDHLRTGCAALARYKAMLQLKKKNEALDGKALEKLINYYLDADSNKIEYLQERHQNLVVNDVIDSNPGLLSKKVLVFPQNEANNHWSVTFVFNPGHIRQMLDDGDNLNHSLQPCFFRYCSLVPDGRRNVAVETGIIWFLNLCYSNEIHEESMPPPNAAIKWLSPFGKEFQGPMVGTQSFPALRLPIPGRLPQQNDGCNCGVGIIAAIAIILRNVCNEKVDQMSFNDQFGNQAKLNLQEDVERKEWYINFDDRFFEPLPTEEKDLILGDYLTMLRKEWFVVMDRMAALHFDVLPKRINKANLVNPLYTETLRATRQYPDPVLMKERQTFSKHKLREIAKRMAEKAEAEKAYKAEAMKQKLKDKSGQQVSFPVDVVDVTQSPNTHATIDLSSPAGKPRQVSEIHDPNAIVDLSSPDAKPTSSSTGVKSDEAMDDNWIDYTPSKSIDALTGNALEDTPEKKEDANEKPKITIKRMKDLSLLTPVKIHVKTPTKKRKCGDLLKRLHLDDVLFEDNDKKQKKMKMTGKPKLDDNEHEEYAVLTKDAKGQRVSTQSSATIEAYHRKYHADPAVADDSIITIDKKFKMQLAVFIAKSFEKWNWFSDENHQKTIADWAKQMKPKDCSESKKEWIRELIKGMKEERAQFTKELTNEFMFTRPTMVKGLRFVKANNSFYARLVYQEPDEADPNTMVTGEEELKVEEEWVRSEYSDVDIQHIINMHQTDMWTDVPRDVEVRIAKHKIVRVRYVPPQVRHVIDYDAMAKVINEKDVTLSKRRKKLGFPELPQERFEQLTLLDKAIPRRKNNKHNPPPPFAKVPRRQMDKVSDTKVRGKEISGERGDEVAEKHHTQGRHIK